MWKLSIEDDQGQSTIVQLVRSEYSVGRTEENSIRLTERNISRRHAKLVKQGAAWFLDDLGSYNGCFVNGLRVVDHHPVSVGDLIQLGDYRLELIADDSVAVAPPQEARPKRPDTLSTTLNLAAQTDRLVMVVGPTPGREYMLAHAQQRIGRGEECDICVNHSSVSRWHADIHYVGSSRYEIIDHNSSNGIRINGVELRRGLLDARDLVELGDIVLKFIPAGQVYRPSPEETKQLAALLGVDVEGAEPTRLERFRLAWSSLSRSTRWGTILLGITVVVLLVLSQANRQTASPIAPDPSTEQAQKHRKTLDQASELLGQGQIVAAHEKLATIPESSNLRRDQQFRNIETRWAEELMRQADAAASTEERRLLLDAVAQATTVDTLTRRKAADALESLRVDAVDVAALPSGASSVGSDGSAPSTEVEAKGDEPGTPTVEESSAPPSSSSVALQNAKTARQRTTTKPSVAGAPRAATSAPTKPSGAEPSATELATSGSLEAQKAARDALRRKVAAGTASERETRLLRALCRQLGDASCSR